MTSPAAKRKRKEKKKNKKRQPVGQERLVPATSGCSVVRSSSAANQEQQEMEMGSSVVGAQWARPI